MLPLTRQEKAALAALIGIIMTGSAGRIVFKLFPTAAQQTDFIERWQPQGKIDINRATLDDLLAVPYIGRARAQAILDYRKLRGPFPEIGALNEVDGLGPKLLEQIRPFITLDKP